MRLPPPAPHAAARDRLAASLTRQLQPLRYSARSATLLAQRLRLRHAVPTKAEPRGAPRCRFSFKKDSFSVSVAGKQVSTEAASKLIGVLVVAVVVLVVVMATGSDSAAPSPSASGGDDANPDYVPPSPGMAASPSPPPPSPPTGGGGSCRERTPGGEWTCAQQQSWGKCDIEANPWMRGYCCETCTGAPCRRAAYRPARCPAHSTSTSVVEHSINRREGDLSNGYLNRFERSLTVFYSWNFSADTCLSMASSSPAQGARRSALPCTTSTSLTSRRRRASCSRTTLTRAAVARCWTPQVRSN